MIEITNITIPNLSGESLRRAYIYLPDSYDKYSKYYPVMYMFDGHNVFYDKDATYGKSWGMKEYMDRTKKQLIIVAIECNHEGFCRLEEYSPVDFTFSPAGKINGRGEEYMNWLVNTLKPHIDNNYRTLPDPDNTIICGSSMGGLMSLYGASTYNRVFHKAACLSPSVWTNPKDILRLIHKSNVLPNTKIYIDYGSEELKDRKDTGSTLQEISDLLLAKGVDLTMRIIPGGTHCEASWEQQIPVFMEFLDL